MQSFVDEALIEVSSGNGGAGCVSFRREKYVPRGGPDGGDGGRGGDVIFRIQSNLKTLYHLKNKKLFKASNGEQGKGKRMHGKNGASVIIPVPPGTLIRDSETGAVLKDFADDIDGEEFIFLQGGRGGQGNWHFRTSRKQTPRYAQPGYPGEEASLRIELSLIADIGLVGFPNAGKSTLLKTLTNANPKVAPYPFTTKIPNLGVFRFWEHDIVIADIPGLIEGASEGLGLGFQFLKHISRTRCLAFLLDCGEEDPLGQYEKLCEELRRYDVQLLDKKQLLIGTKLDLEDAADRFKALNDAIKGHTIVGISSLAETGLEELKQQLLEMVR